MRNLIIANFVSFTCCIIAGYLAANKIDGWGWFLFMGFLFYHWIKHIKDTPTNEAPEPYKPPMP